jgi:hypothetical protein
MFNRRVGKEELAKHLLIVFFVVAGLGFLARPAAAGTITVAWDLMTEANVTGYRVYVGTSPADYSQTFDVPADKDFFIFRNAFMGVRYYFAVAAQFDNATYGPRSPEVTSVGTRTVSGSLPDGARVPDPTVASDCGADCFVVTDVARGLGEISSLAVAADGSVFAVESGRRVVRLRDGAVVTAFEAEPGTTLRDVALDRQFDTTGRVFVSLLRARDRSTGELEVLRLRYLAGALGEPSTIVTGVSVPLAAMAPLAVGDDGLVYVALPTLIARHPYSAAVLAFDQDGRVPAGQRSPIVARGLEEPADMAWDAQSRTLWLVGRDSRSNVQVLSVSRSADAGVPVSNVVSADESAAGVAVAAGAARRLLVAAGVDLIEAAPGTVDSVRISLEAYGSPVAVTAAGGARYVATRIEGVTDSYRVVKVEDGNARAAR